MLSRIVIQNFALIDHLDIQLHNGLQVITGETGAGKSIILGALRLIMGERADLKSISNAEKKSVVEAEFTLTDAFKAFFEAQDLDFETESIIRREILPSGKSRAFINDRPVTLDLLKTVAAELIDIHSQFETSQLFEEAYQFQIIDAVSDNKKIIPQYQVQFSEYQKLKRELVQLKDQFANANKESDYKLFLLTELEDANLDDLNFQELQDQLGTQENAGMILEQLNFIIQKFQQEELGLLAGLAEAKQKLQKVAEVSPHFEELQRRFEEIFVEVKDILNEIETEAETLDIDPEALALMLAKVNALNALFLKHQVSSVEELVSLRDQLLSEQSGFADIEFNISNTEAQIVAAEKNLDQLAQNLSKNRAKYSPDVVNRIEKLLKQLGLEKAKVAIDIQTAKQFNAFGKEEIQILFQANTGFPMKPIQSAISGGERSRVMLSIKKILAENSNLPTLILDEIDTGVSGRVAEEIGKVMRDMAGNMQLIVITHLAQVAAKGDFNYKVTKQDIDGKTRSNIISLNEEDKLMEIAQLLSGSNVTEAAISQAKELMK